MSQPRMRKVVTNGDEGSRARASVAKASGDSVACSVRPNQQTIRSRNKNKIPKSVRYDLENALVSLCDVWFEEIKPHLVRNNIKLHVHGSSAGGDHERAAPPQAPCTPPVPPSQLASAAPGCKHLDPGAASDHPRRRDASSVGCYSTPPTASRVPFAKLRTRNRCFLSPVPSLPPTPLDSTRTQAHKCEEKQLKRPRIRRKKRKSVPQPQWSCRVPRPCQTYSVLSPSATGSHTRRIVSPHPPPPPREQNYRFYAHRRKYLVKNKDTQTEKDLPRSCVDVGCQWDQPLCSSLLIRRFGSHPEARSPRHSSPSTRKPAPCKPAPCNPAPYNPAPCDPVPCNPAPSSRAPRNSASCKSAPWNPAPWNPAPCNLAPYILSSRSPVPCIPRSRNRSSCSPVLSIPNSGSHAISNTSSRNPSSCVHNPRNPAPHLPGSSSRVFSGPSPSQRSAVWFKPQEPTITEKPLFQDDLIDILGETNDKRLRLLYRSPETDDYPSLMNLIPLSNTRQTKPGGCKKQAPWR